MRGKISVPARVAWAGNDRVGLEFLYAIDEHEVLVQLGRGGARGAAELQPAGRRAALDRRRAQDGAGLGRRRRPQHSGKRRLRAPVMDPWSPEWFLRPIGQGGPAISGTIGLAEFPPPRRRDLEPQDRVSERVSVELGAGLRQRGAHGVSVQILDLSTHGFRASTHLVLHEGHRRLAAPAGPRSLPGQGRLGERLYHRLRVRTAAPPRRARDDRRAKRATPEPLADTVFPRDSVRFGFS